MKQVFEIYPSLFMITRRRESKFPGLFQFPAENEKDLYKEPNGGYESSFPHMHYGNCAVNAAHTLVTLKLGNTIGAASELDLPDSLLGQLKIETYKGKKYIISYVPVLN